MSSRLVDVERPALCSAAAGADLGDDLFQAIGATRAQENFCAFAREEPRSGFTDPAAGTGDEDALSSMLVFMSGPNSFC
jgi:hypothetical protein